jgi:glutamate-1-semialdehyde 2,1-aminomutase
MVSGAATFEQLTPEVYQQLDLLAERLREGIRAVCGEFDVPVQVTGLGSLLGVHFNDRPIRSVRDSRDNDDERRQQVFLGLMNEGIWTSPNLIGAISTPMGESEIDAYPDALRAVLARG